MLPVFYFRHMLKTWIRTLMWGLPAVACATLGLRGFLIPNGFIDGGVIGVSMLMYELTDISLAFWIVLINAPFLVLGYRTVNLRFALLSALIVTILSVTVGLVPTTVVTQQPILAAIFGGVFLGAGTGLAIRGASVLDGTEILALYVSRRVGFSVGELIMVINLVIFGAAAFILGLEPALYSILTYLGASRTIDYILHGLEQYTAVTIVSSRSEDIRKAITQQTNRGVTVYNARGGFSDKPIDVLYCVVTRLEISGIKRIIDEHDPGAFLTTHSLNEAGGGLLRRTSHI